MYECDMIHNDFKIFKGFEPENMSTSGCKSGQEGPTNVLLVITTGNSDPQHISTWVMAY